MDELIKHRGPDDEGTFVDGRVSLGNVRLAIIDLTPSGHQPMSYSARGRSVWITYNGEIFNYREVKSELTRLGYAFASDSDTEVILASYIEWGMDCVEKFNGMWAFAIYDPANDLLILSRDRFGVKPLYFHIDAGRVSFSSEIKGLFALKIEHRPNDEAVFEYLKYGLHDHKRTTFFEGVSRVMPGENAIFHLNDSSLDLKKYYDLEKRTAMRGPTTAENFRSVFDDAVKTHMVSDVPVGSCLSGGLDSTSLLCAMRENYPRATIRVFSLEFPGDQIDEGPYQRDAAEAMGAERYSTTFTPRDLLENMKELVWTQEEPFIDMTIYGQFEVMRLARSKGMKVLLDGQGADEIFAGYYYLAAYYYYDLLRTGRLLKLAKEMRARHRANPQTTRYFLGLLLPNLLKRYLVSRQRRFIRKEFASQYRGWDSRFSRKSLAEALVEATTLFPLPSLLRYEDKNSMRWSVESRVPYLDYRLVELVAGLPNGAKIDEGYSKVILREAMAGHLPPSVERRRDKVNFGTPEKRLLSSEELTAALKTIVDSNSFKNRKYWDWKRVHDMIPGLSRGGHLKIMKSEDLWRVILVELWMELWIDEGSTC